MPSQRSTRNRSLRLRSPTRNAALNRHAPTTLNRRCRDPMCLAPSLRRRAVRHGSRDCGGILLAALLLSARRRKTPPPSSARRPGLPAPAFRWPPSQTLLRLTRQRPLLRPRPALPRVAMPLPPHSPPKPTQCGIPPARTSCCSPCRGAAMATWRSGSRWRGGGPPRASTWR